MKKILLILAIICPLLSSAQVETIRNINVVRNITFPTVAVPYPTGYFVVTAEFRLPLPAQLVGNPNAGKLAQTYKNIYNIERLDTIGNDVYVVFSIEPISRNIFKVENDVQTSTFMDDEDVQMLLEDEYYRYELRLAQFALFPFDLIIGKSLKNTTWGQED